MVNQKIQALVKECQAGNSDAFGGVYDEYVKKIYDYIYYRTFHKPTAEDLVSVIFTKAYSKIADYDEAQGAFQSWLYRIAKNTLIDHYRTRKEVYDIEDAWGIKTEENFEQNVDLKAKLSEVKEYLQTLPDEHRDLVIMRVWDQLSYREISEITGKSEAALKVSMSRIMGKLRTQVSVGALILLILS